uniref:Disease resistance protein RPP13 n=1 Tax=Aegilops tauschii subsp. strangulata TaxID=200361 RepID=A0A453LG04_AEGTS
MEIVATAFVGRVALKLFAFLDGNYKLRRNLEHDIQRIRMELDMIDAAIHDHDGRRSSSQVQTAWIQLARELGHSIDDCIDRFSHRLAKDAAASPLRKTVSRLKTAPIRTEFAAEIRKIRKISEEVSKLRECYGGGESSTSEASAPGALSEEAHALAADLVGMDAPRDELLDLIRDTDGHPKQLKVISIVGFGGSGKTLLAREVYESDTVVCQYKARAWVRAADKGAVDVLKEILEELGMQVTGDARKLSTHLRKCLGSKRFFIVIDDMRTELWNTMKNSFPAVMGVSSRVVVTTPIQYIANACSSAHGHVYAMRTLSEDLSRQLFLKEASLEDSSPSNELGSEALKKCDGLPLALVTTAQFLQSRGDPTWAEWARLCNNLGEHLETEDTLARMKSVVRHSYASLPDHFIKTFLLYLGIFPRDRPVRRERLIRRWLAEGLFGGDAELATCYFKKLVDHSIIRPIDVSNNTKVKTCQTHGMMLEFILHKSRCENFVTLSHDQARPPGKTRWLSLHHESAGRARMSREDLPFVRSLTIFGKAHKSVLDFSKYELLRVLDLEECQDELSDKHLKEICNLLLLRYLGLGGPIAVLPKEIAKLKLLETLDITRTKIEILPVEVIELPCLIHLFGKFKLEDVSQRVSKLQRFLSEKSNLQTLSGFVADKGIAQLMDHMNNLTRVKIWCESTTEASSITHLSKSIKGFIQRGSHASDHRSLSLNFNECSEDLLSFTLEKSCHLSKLKLQGNIFSLPPFVTALAGLTELCLSSLGKFTGDVLASLSMVHSLQYLKLIATHMEKFVIRKGQLNILLRMCIVVQSMEGLEIEEEALPCFESLQLLCKGVNGFGGIRMELLGRLKEVALDDGLSDKAKQEWKEAAKMHPRRPKVLFIKTNNCQPHTFSWPVRHDGIFPCTTPPS